MYFYDISLVQYFAMISRNPCYNGRCISTFSNKRDNNDNYVAILVIMEDVFLPQKTTKTQFFGFCVAILVIMEDVFLP